MTAHLGSGIDIFLHPGDWYFGDRDTRIRTTLGSCVAVTLWHRELKLGGMCHYMLPGPSLENALNARYGEDALQLLVAEIRQQGTAVTDYEAKLFGGASMFDVGPHGSSVARRNVEAAEALMLRHGVTVTARSLGGTGYRRLFFNIADGDVWVSRGESRAEPAGAVSSGGAV
ncbi:chemotaxis protein CheD [Marinobacter gudaonensis]|uniref:Probable chemoreceptor glutamine deamidase CheD n=1 Tax=Marinobacter gudaonensis TaxID=375760 RepID=A0A1I6GN51_9GAMM|nr:chemotaxis protein CheD [Marinobacter gudaonensis]SFR43655.1 chemotaxis protein CheD [Marinobacter gudaonensis]